MKNFKLMILFVVVFCLFAACSDDAKEPEIPDPQANLSLKINLATSDRKITSSVNGELISDLSYEMEDIAGLLYILHEAPDGGFIKFHNISQEDMASRTVDGVLTLEDQLPFGRYFITLVANTDHKLENNLLRALSENYFEAACQVPNNHVFYKTMAVDIMQLMPLTDQEEAVNLDVTLHLLTGEFNFLLPAGSKGIPQGANFSMKVELSDLPSAFFLKDGKTLTNNEVAKLGLHKYNQTFEITTPFESQLVAKYYQLDNQELEDTKEDRGYFQFTYKEDAESEVVTRYIDTIMPECRVDPTIPIAASSTTWMNDLYSEKQEDVKTLLGESQILSLK